MKYSDIIKKLNEDTVYHGTDAEFDEFDYKFVGKGNDSYGYGFYFTTYEHAAQGYGKNVFTADINLKKPIVVSATDPKPEQFPKFSRKQIKQIILDAPEYEDVLWNFGDLGSSSVEKVLDIAVNEYTKTGDQFFSLMNDFYRDYPEEFNKAVHKATGYDGVEVFWKNEPEAKFIIAWFKDQVKVIKKTVKESKYLEFDLGSDTLMVYKISSKAEFNGLLNKFKSIRGFLVPEGLFVWDAYKATHDRFGDWYQTKEFSHGNRLRFEKSSDGKLIIEYAYSTPEWLIKSEILNRFIGKDVLEDAIFDNRSNDNGWDE